MALGGCGCCAGTTAGGWYGNDDGWFDEDGLNENCGGLWHKTINNLISFSIWLKQHKYFSQLTSWSYGE